MSSFWERLLGPDTISEILHPRKPSPSPSFYCPTCVESSEVFRCPKCEMTCEYRVSFWDLLIDGVVPHPVPETPQNKTTWTKVKLIGTNWIKGQASLTIFKLLKDNRSLPTNFTFTRADLRRELDRRGYLKFQNGRSLSELRSHIAKRQHGKAKNKNR